MMMHGASVILVGRQRAHHLAEGFASEVQSFLRRYVREVVKPYQLCPYVGGDEASLGTVIVALDPEPTAHELADAVRDASAQVVHLVTPLLEISSHKYERFAGEVANAYRNSTRRKIGDATLVHAAFHPAMVGGQENAHRMVGVLRNSPDPFIQFIPSGIQEGGTVLQMLQWDMPAPVDLKGHAERTFKRLLESEAFAQIGAQLALLRSERNAAYAPYLAAFCAERC